jgi:predicted amidophosphoribosyltransferase
MIWDGMIFDLLSRNGTAFKGLATLAAHMIWPVSCPVCGAMGRLLCEECLRSLLKPQLPRCLVCGRVIPCSLHKDGAKIYAASDYRGDTREIILMLKYGGFEALGFQIGRACAEVIRKPDSIDVLVPVPLHLNSKRRYNQAFAIAKGLARAWGVEARSAARWTADESTRAGLSASERQALSSDAFEFDKTLAGLRVGLVDDVCTTGSTLSRLAAAAASVGIEVAGAFVAAAPDFR